MSIDSLGEAATRSRAPAAVLWDMDGTLVDTEPYWFDAERELVESFGGTWSDDDAHAVVGFDLLDSAAYIRDRGGVPLDPVEIVDRMLASVVDRLRDTIPWRPGVLRLLGDLNKAGVPCALVTMSWHRLVDPIVDALPPGSFVAVVTGDDVPPGKGKPDPTPYVMGANACGAAPEDCVAIEDSPTGVRSALGAGCAVLGVPNVRSLEPAVRLTLRRSLDGVTLDDLGDLLSDREPVSAATATVPRRRDRRGLLLASGLAAAAAIVGLGLVGDDADGPPPLPPGAVPVDVWAPYWTLADILPFTDARLAQVREVSPFWYGARGATEIVVDENASTDAIDQFLEQVRASDARVVPSIRDEMPAGGMAAVLADPVSRASHIDTIVAFAEQLEADGIDLDYEQFAFADGADSWAATSPNWVAFVAELSTALHDDDRTLTVSIPAVFDEAVTGNRGYWVYDHGAIAEHVDAIRIMAYDFSVAEAGPIAPLSWVSDAVDGVSKAVPEEFHDKLVLGVPAYGRNWVVATTGTCPPTAEGTNTVDTRSVLELATLRGGVPAFDPAIGEWSFTYDLTVTDPTASCVQSRMVRWVDSEGVAARVEVARRAGWGGVALWAFGYDDDETWTTLVSAARAPLSA